MRYETENKLTVRVVPKIVFSTAKINFWHAEFIAPIDKSGVIPLSFGVYVSEKLPGNFKTNPRPLLPLRECIS